MGATKVKASTKAQKEPVRLRERELTNGSKSLYLDIYRDGKREYEYLKLYLIKATTPIEKEQNRQTLGTAQAIKAKRQIEIQNGEYGFASSFKTDTPFLAYFRKLCEERKASTGNYGNWHSCLKHLEHYANEKTTFKQIGPDFIDGFKDYLNNTAKDLHKYRLNNISDNEATKPLSQNSKVSYFNKLRACINQAFDDRILPINPLRGIDGFKQDETERVYLTLDEVKKLAKTDCKYPVLKRAFLFSCLTGIRKSDIEKMIWGEIQTFGDFTRVVFKQKKTGGQEYLDINKQAEEYLGERDIDNSRVFSGFRYNSQVLIELKRWCLKAGITKDVTFHSGRHTFAVMMLDLGAELYTVSKLLGHKEIKTTQIYAKVLDKKKQEAICLIPDIT
ncbi:Phage integrase family protein [Bacteroides luti]|uniref:Phage integrase family protein n=1 Tax=Bacteroides luti TaxID=1297750 RepID=A0A1M4XNI6_9BACE|nr:site-specific integrase [Bacteroides luti]SHE95049.1 Phage integrase family protein [Bacteroides luti]